MSEKDAYARFVSKYKTGAERKTALSKMPASQIDKIARACPNKTGQAVIASYKHKSN